MDIRGTQVEVIYYNRKNRIVWEGFFSFTSLLWGIQNPIISRGKKTILKSSN